MAATAKGTGNTDKTKNLKQWKPGQSGNPNGRPKDRLRPALRAALTDEDIKQINALAILDAKSKDPEIRAKARQWLFEQVDGKLIDRLEKGGANAFAEAAEQMAGMSRDELRKIIKRVDAAS